MQLLEIMNLKHYVRDRLLFEANHLHVDDNQIIGLVGDNGSGKTNLLSIIEGTITAEEGTIDRKTTVELVPQIKKIDDEKSGGEMTQAYIQQAINHSAGLLLLDEPTTHLDFKHIDWLKEKLNGLSGAMIIVSHDRDFLSAMCTDIWEINDEKIEVYHGGYETFIEEKEKVERHQMAEYEKYEKKKSQLEEAIKKKEEKAARATKAPKRVSNSEASQMGAKPYFAKKQKKLRKTASALESRLDQLEEVKKPEAQAPIKMQVYNEEALKDRIIIRGEKVTGNIGERILWSPFSFNIKSGEKVAVIGENGSGKTTLINKILNDSNEITVSPAVKIAYFSQHLTIVDEEKTILENMKDLSSQDETTIRTVLARMHFWQDDVFKRVGVLSGGEKVKVALAKLFLSDVNVLVLDEPTNFLDINSLEALEALMKSYKGTIIFVSHDRMLLKNVASQILSIEDRQVIEFDGTFAEFENRNTETKRDIKKEKLLLLDNKIADVLSQLSIEPSEELDAEFQALLKEKKQLEYDD
ncbi:ABC-F type ribosomal protection protein [Jeotgalicoccus huakuii]|nr:ABC-F type ribosomal protection protein [Jeotgalicoccus huakuii]